MIGDSVSALFILISAVEDFGRMEACDGRSVNLPVIEVKSP
jgi:hypothetical protein